MKILVVDDDRLTRRMLGRMLGALGHDVSLAADGLEAWELLERDPQDLLLTDWMMPGLDGLQLIERVRAAEHIPWLYILLLTAKDESAALVRGIEAGADDFVRKPFEREELRVRIRAGQRIVRMQKELEALVGTDPLTGAINRRGLERSLHDLCPPPLGPDGACGFVMADIDHFKRVNDTWGHEAGDLVICGVVNRLRVSVRPYDLVSRLGGEEFLLVILGDSLEQLAATAERLRAAVRAKPFRLSQQDTIPVTVSIGVYHRAPGEDCPSFEQAIARADAALYCAKRSGRDRVVVWNPEL